MIRESIKFALKLEKCPVTVNTVDGFQGSENNIIILSTVRRRENDYKPEKNKSIGFLKDKRRANVALSRGKCLTMVIGEARLLKTCDIFDELIK